MAPLFAVLRNNSRGDNQCLVCVPPDSEIASVIVNNRCPQSVVRAHVFRGSTLASMVSLTGAVAKVQKFDTISPSNDGETPSLFAAVGVIEVTQGSVVSRADIASFESLPAADGRVDSVLYVVFLERALTEHAVTASPLKPAQPHRSRSGTVPLWQRLPNTVTQYASRCILGKAQVVPSALLERVHSDEQAVLPALEEMVAEKAQPLPPEASAAITKRFEDAMLRMDTDVTMFQSAYFCMIGYEDFITVKVSQLIEGAVEGALGEETEGASASECNWVDDEREVFISGIHAIVTGALASKLVAHWTEVEVNDDFAFSHACAKLAGVPQFLQAVVGLKELNHVDPSAFAPAVEIVRLIDTQAVSVFSYMRLMEATISSIVEIMQQLHIKAEITADTCIPLIVFVIVEAKPLRIASRIKYILDLNLPLLEMSSLGYAMTTFEAATAQVLEEYKVRVLNKE